MEEPLLAVRDLRVGFHTEDGFARAVDGVSFELQPGETLGLVGESGCGKSVTALSILGLVPSPPGEVLGGEVRFAGRDLLALDERALRGVRGNAIAMVFQEPMTALNPVFTIGDQIAESVRLHERKNAREARAAAIEMLTQVGIPSPAERVDAYPHQLSGGMRQRVMIAIAMACDPRVLIADEPTTALDVTVQAQILDLIEALQERAGTSVLLITHDLGVVAERADRALVMYAGRIVEAADVESLFEAPRHPYTRGLLRSLPELSAPGERLQPIEGVVPSALDWPSGCRFRTRCPLASARCAEEEPALVALADRLPFRPGVGARAVACHHHEEVEAP